MKEHLNQAKHNEDFHDYICQSPQQMFYDWRITCLFYAAIHYLHALAFVRGKNIGKTHDQVNYNINARKNGASMPLKDRAFHNYIDLYRYSKKSRYDGFTDSATFETLMKTDYEDALKCFEAFRHYVSVNKVPV